MVCSAKEGPPAPIGGVTAHPFPRIAGSRVRRRAYPARSHWVRVWHERVSEQTETLRVPADGLASGTLALDARGFVRAPYCRALVGVQRRDDILDQTFEAAEPLEASWGFITNEDFTRVAHADEPSAFGELLVDVH